MQTLKHVPMFVHSSYTHVMEKPNNTITKFTELVPGKYLVFHYRPQRSCGQGNIFTPVCHSVHRGEGSASVHAGIPTPRSRHSPRADTPPEQTPPQSRHHPPRPDPPQSRHPRSRHPPGLDPPGSRLQHTVYERLV